MEKETTDLKKADAKALKRKKKEKGSTTSNRATDMTDGVPMEVDPTIASNIRARDPRHFEEMEAWYKKDERWSGTTEG
jgi:hypothetical protein